MNEILTAAGYEDLWKLLEVVTNNLQESEKDSSIYRFWAYTGHILLTEIDKRLWKGEADQ